MAKLDRTNYEGGREQAYVKHYLLEKYLSSWAYIIGGSAWDSLVFVDGFAGPWGAKHEGFADASFGIAVRALNQAIDGLFETRQIVVRGLCIFVETKPKPFARLDRFAKENSTDSVRAIALRGRFIENITAIDAEVATVGANPFKFVFLDQKGWAATPMAKLRPFLRDRSCEILFNLMTSFITRFVDARSREASYNELFGRPGVLEKIRALPKGTGEREEAAVQEYSKSLRNICNFQYVSQAVILDPRKEKVLYHLVFATKNPRGIEVFKKAEIEAARIQDEVRYETYLRKTEPELPGLFDSGPPRSRLVLQLWRRYTELARKKILKILSANNSVDGVPYKDLFREAMAFPLVSPDDLVKWLRSLEPDVTIRFEFSDRRKNPKKPSAMHDDRVFVVNLPALRRRDA